MVIQQGEWNRSESPAPLLLRVEEAARLIGIGRSQMYKLAAGRGDGAERDDWPVTPCPT